MRLGCPKHRLMATRTILTFALLKTASEADNLNLTKVDAVSQMLCVPPNHCVQLFSLHSRNHWRSSSSEYPHPIATITSEHQLIVSTLGSRLRRIPTWTALRLSIVWFIRQAIRLKFQHTRSSKLTFSTYNYHQVSSCTIDTPQTGLSKVTLGTKSGTKDQTELKRMLWWNHSGILSPSGLKTGGKTFKTN